MHKTQPEANYPVHLNYLSPTILKNVPMGLPDRQLMYFGFGKLSTKICTKHVKIFTFVQKTTKLDENLDKNEIHSLVQDKINIGRYCCHNHIIELHKQL